ncbi:two-component system activity regulator YycH [Weissella ceti]|uniref:two-component system activity regulator YycH n=1 Tax=Weissella ceti TaxID=759620 RepID=UPI001BCB1B47|nr:two-component system activity regulator YycH [Weissella ceti]QVK12157.1 hypothetical protein KHQ31_00355 [Weissella ceti]
MNRRKWRGLLKQYLLIVLLALLVMISLMLSFGIWGTMGERSVYLTSSDTNESEKRLVSEKDVEAVYDFDAVVVNQDKKHKRIMNSRGINREILSALGDWQVENVSAEKMKNNEYLKLLNENDTVLLGYPDQVIGSLVEARLNISVGLTDDDRIDWIQLPMNGKGEIRFFDDRTQDVYRAKVDQSGTALADMQWPSDQTEVEFEWRKERVRINYLKNVKLKTKSYLLDEAEKSNVVSAAFKSTEGTPFIVENDNGDIEYTDGDTRRLVLDSNSGNVSLTEYDNTHIPKLMSNNMSHAYETLVAIKQVPENMYYFEELDEGMKLSYRLYVNGFPMFKSQNFDFGTASVAYEPNRQTIEYSLYSLQVPLPDKDEKTISLGNTKSVMKALRNAGVDTAEVQGTSLGYRWLEYDQERYITLQPGWFVQINNEWLPLSAYTGGM